MPRPPEAVHESSGCEGDHARRRGRRRDACPARCSVETRGKTANGRPDLNGVWQTLNEANFDIQMHVARPAMALGRGRTGQVPRVASVLALGAAAGRPPRRWRCRGRRVTVPAGCAEDEAREPGALAHARPGDQVLPAGRAARHLHAVSVSDLPQRRGRAHRVRVCRGRAQHLHEGSRARPVDSWMGQSVGRWDGDTLVVDVTGFNDQTWFDRVGQLSQRRVARGRALHAHRRR